MKTETKIYFGCLISLVVLLSLVGAASTKIMEVKSFDMEINNLDFNNVYLNEYVPALPGDSIKINYVLYNLNATKVVNISAQIYLIDDSGQSYLVHEISGFNLSGLDSVTKYATFNFPAETGNDSRIFLNVFGKFENGTRKYSTSYEVRIYARQVKQGISNLLNPAGNIPASPEVKEKIKQVVDRGTLIIVFTIIIFLVLLSIFAIVIAFRSRKVIVQTENIKLKLK